MSETLFGSDDSQEAAPDVDQDLIALYRKQGRTLDDLPYTPEFEAIYLALVGDGGEDEPLAHLTRSHVLHRLHNLRKAGRLPRLGRSPSSPPKIAQDDERLLLNLVADAVGKASKRDQLPYTDAFDAIVTRFNSETSHNLSPHDLWRVISRLAKRSGDAVEAESSRDDSSPTELQLANALSRSDRESDDDAADEDAPQPGAADRDAKPDAAGSSDSKQAKSGSALFAVGQADVDDSTAAPAGPSHVGPRVYDVSREGYESVADGYTLHARRTMHGAAIRIEHCLKQLSNVDIWWRPHPSINAIGNIVLHVMGNLGQWVIEGVGEKRFYRDRNAEFAQRHPIPRDELIERLRNMVRDCDRVMAALDADALVQPRRVQGFETDKMGAIFHSVTHLEGHAQEVIYITRLRLGDDYEFLFKPAGAEQLSSEWNIMRELDLLHHIYKATSASERVTIPPGDDMGCVRIAGQDVLVTVDQVADGVHFLIDETDIKQIARKAITRNLSDVAAMAAKPVGAVASVALYEELKQPFATELFEQMRKIAEHYDCPLFGGDITIWKNPLHISVTLLAEPAGIEPVLRQGAQAGDVIFVTGQLGGSMQDVDGYVHHLGFEPRIDVARKLAGDKTTRPRCMLDLSDGLASDLPRLCRMGESKHGAGLAAVVDLDRLPVSKGAEQAASKSGKPAWVHAMIDGEDYELCFLLPADRAHDLPAKMAGVHVTRIGEIVEPEVCSALIQLRHPDGTIEPMGEGIGWEHRSGD